MPLLKLTHDAPSRPPSPLRPPLSPPLLPSQLSPQRSRQHHPHPHLHLLPGTTPGLVSSSFLSLQFGALTLLLSSSFNPVSTPSPFRLPPPLASHSPVSSSSRWLFLSSTKHAPPLPHTPQVLVLAFVSPVVIYLRASLSCPPLPPKAPFSVRLQSS